MWTKSFANDWEILDLDRSSPKVLRTTVFWTSGSVVERIFGDGRERCDALSKSRGIQMGGESLREAEIWESG
jgi:hypothetical protein